MILDIRGHRLAWSVIVSGLLAMLMLWGSILGVPLARHAASEMDAPAAMGNIEHPVEIRPSE